MPAQRVMRQLELVALADQEAERPLAVARRVQRSGEATGEQLAGGVQLAVPVLSGERGADLLAGHPELGQPALDPLGAPAVESAPVLGEAAGIGGVVDVPTLAQLAQHLLSHVFVYALSREVGAQLRLCAIALAELPPGDVERLLAAQLGVQRRRVGARRRPIVVV